MPSAEYDLRYLQAGAQLLEKYLLSPDIYWPIGERPPAGSPPYPQLTLGGILLALQRARAQNLPPTQSQALAQVEEAIEHVRSRWRVAWGQKAAAEFRSRLTLWRNFIEDYRENPEANLDRYAYEVRRRVILQLLEKEAGEVPESERTLLAGMDKMLQAVFQPGDFVWEPELAGGFPQNAYWYLYGHPKAKGQ